MEKKPTDMSERNDKREQRQSGFYWVNFTGIEWEIGRYGASGFWTLGDDVFNDSDFAEIDERRIERSEPELSRLDPLYADKMYAGYVHRCNVAKMQPMGFEQYKGFMSDIL